MCNVLEQILTGNASVVAGKENGETHELEVPEQVYEKTRSAESQTKENKKWEDKLVVEDVKTDPEVVLASS